VGLYNTEILTYEDLEWYLRVALTHSIHLIDGPPIASYRKDSENVLRRFAPETIAHTYIEILEKQLERVRNRYTGDRNRKIRRLILARLAEFYWTRREKEEVRARLFEALRLDHSLLLDWHSLKHLVFSL